MNNNMLSTTTSSRWRWRPNRRRRRRRQCHFPPVSASLFLTALSLLTPSPTPPCASFPHPVASAADTPNILSPIETVTFEEGEAHVNTPDDPADVAATLDRTGFSPYGFQSGYFPDAPFYRSEILEEEEEEEEEEQSGGSINDGNTNNGRQHDLLHHLAANQLEDLDDDSFAGGMIYDAARHLVYFAGSTYGRYFDHGAEDSEDGAGNFGSHLEAGSGGSSGSTSFQQKRGDGWSHLTTSDCFFGVLQLPRAKAPSFQGSSSGIGDPGSAAGNTPPWLLHLDEDSLNSNNSNNHHNETVRLIYSRRFGTAHHSEACSALVALPRVDDALLQHEGQFKIALLGHVNPIPLSSQESSNVDGGGKFNGGLLSSLSNAGPVQSKARSYGFVADLDVSLVPDSPPSSPTQQSSSQYSSSSGAFGAFLGGYVLESSPLVYPVALAQNTRDPNQIYVVSMHADDPPADDAVSSRYATPLSHEVDGTLRDRPDLTLGGSGGTGMEWMEGRRDWYLGGIPKYGEEFYVKVQALTVLPYQELMDVAPSDGEKVKRTFESGWGFGFKLNDAKDVRPSCIHFVKGRTPDDDLLLLAGTTRKSSNDADGQELDGFVTKLLPPAPSPVPDSAMQMHGENTHPTKRIDSTTGRDETVSFICLPPPNPNTGAVTHAFVVGSTTNHGAGESSSSSSVSGKGKEPSLAYILLMKLDDMSTIWKQRVSAIHPAGIGGNVLGEGCAVSDDGLVVYLTGTMDGGSALNTGNPNVPPSKPVGGTTDVFVVAYDVPFGNALWGKQLGTVYEDKLARGGGVSTDNEGNVMIMGTTRGALQRHRPDPSDMLNSNPAAKHPFAADIFFMSLSRVDGSYVNAPYSGPSPEGGSSPKSETASVAGAASDTSENGNNKNGLNGGVIAGIVIMVLAIVAGTSLFAIGRDRSSKRQQRMWNADDNGDDFSFDGNRGGLGFRIGGYRNNFQSGVARGSDDKPQSEDWDDGEDRIHATWMKKPQHNNDDKTNKPPSASSRFKAELDSLKSAVVTRGSSSSIKSGGNSSRSGIRPSLSNDADDDHSVSSSHSSASSASRLRMETKMAMNKMFDEVDATDPRLDDGASIKNLLSHYREVRKGKLLDTDVDSVKSGSAKSSAPNRSGKKRDNPTGEGNRQEGSSPCGGLSEFTIV